MKRFLFYLGLMVFLGVLGVMASILELRGPVCQSSNHYQDLVVWGMGNAKQYWLIRLFQTTILFLVTTYMAHHFAGGMGEANLLQKSALLIATFAGFWNLVSGYPGHTLLLGVGWIVLALVLHILERVKESREFKAGKFGHLITDDDRPIGSPH